jgi:signal peptide peptidase SppA
MPKSVLDVLFNTPQAWEPHSFANAVDIALTRARGEHRDLDAIEARLGQPLQREPQGYQVRDGVAVIPIEGIVARRMNLLTRISGGVSTELVARDVQNAVADSAVKAILLDVDSPGGSVEGVQALADSIFAARSRKPIVALANERMSSAAYWLGSSASEVYAASDTAAVGSIGVVMSHVDTSQREAMAGIKTTEIYSGKYKRVASEHAPLTDEGREYLQAQTDAVYSIFVDQVARNRGVSTATVLSKMADGRTFLGRQAQTAGLIDGIATLDQLVSDLAAGRKPVQRRALYSAPPVAKPAAPAVTQEQSVALACINRWKASPELRALYQDCLPRYVDQERAKAGLPPLS